MDPNQCPSSTYQNGIKAPRKKSTNYKNKQKGKSKLVQYQCVVFGIRKKYVRSPNNYRATTYLCSKSEQYSK